MKAIRRLLGDVAMIGGLLVVAVVAVVGVLLGVAWVLIELVGIGDLGPVD